MPQKLNSPSPIPELGRRGALSWSGVGDRLGGVVHLVAHVDAVDHAGDDLTDLGRVAVRLEDHRERDLVALEVDGDSAEPISHLLGDLASKAYGLAAGADGQRVFAANAAEPERHQVDLAAGLGGCFGRERNNGHLHS